MLRRRVRLVRRERRQASGGNAVGREECVRAKTMYGALGGLVGRYVRGDGLWDFSALIWLCLIRKWVVL